MASTLNEEVFEPNVIVLGVFGYTNSVTEQDLHENTLNLILQEIGRIPDKILLPSEGNSSIYINEWAESLRIKTQIFQADWIRNGKIAQIIRDDRIQKECTHSLIFLSKRSTRLEKFAEKIAKKGKIVFTSSHNQTLTQLEKLHSEPADQASTHAHKSDKGTMLKWLKYQTTK